jgi:hypothetical protein
LALRGGFVERVFSLSSPKEERVGVRRPHCFQFKIPSSQPSPRFGREKESEAITKRAPGW